MRPLLKLIFPAIFIVSVAASGIANLYPNREATRRQPPQAAKDMAGDWNATLAAGTQSFRLLLKVKKVADGSYTASMDSLDQGAMDLRVSLIELKGNAFHFEMPDIGASFDGNVNAERTEIIGTWTQGSAGLPLLFRRAGAEASRTVFQRGSLKLEPCNLPQLTIEARCGKYEVFEDRNAKAGRKISLNILILPATGDKPASDPLFFLAGGPGQGAVSVAMSGLGSFLSEIRREREVVFVDQRGTGGSNPLNCNFFGDRDDMRGYFIASPQVDAVKQCRAELEKVANLALYTTPLSMDDLDEVRGALGYEKINLYGGSYGTNAALVYMRQHPNRVRSTVLRGVAPTDYKLPLPFARGVQNAMDRLMEDCAADEQCHKAFPNLKAEFLSILEKLDKGPINVDVMNVVTEKAQQVPVSRLTFIDSVRVMLYVPDLTSLLPLIIHTAYEGDFAPFAAYAFLLIRQIDPQIAKGMQLSVVCSEHLPFITEADVARETGGTYYGDGRVRMMQAICKQWPSVKAPATFIAPVKSDIPTLLISGEVDPVTPSTIAAAAAKLLTNSRHIVIHNGTHLTESPCINRLVAEFFSKGSGQGLDVSCANEIKRPSFTYSFPTTFRPSAK